MALESFLTNELTADMVRELEDFLDSQDTGHVFQFPQWADSGSKTILLREAGKIVWSGTFGLHPPLGYKVPWIRAATAVRGPVCDDRRIWNAGVEQLGEIMAKAGVTFFEVAPDWVQAAEGDAPDVPQESGWEVVGAARTSLRLSLAPSLEELFARFRKNSRYEIRRAEQLGVEVSVASGAEIDEFLRLHERLSQRKGFALESADGTWRRIAWLMQGESRGALLLARTGATVLGGAVVGRSGRRCYYIWGAAERLQNASVGQILQWKALQWAKSHGCVAYDFGGYTPGATSGPAWFKAGFGGAVVHCEPMRRRVLAPVRYRVFRILSSLRKRFGV